MRGSLAAVQADCSRSMGTKASARDVGLVHVLAATSLCSASAHAREQIGPDCGNDSLIKQDTSSVWPESLLVRRSVL